MAEFTSAWAISAQQQRITSFKCSTSSIPVHDRPVAEDNPRSHAQFLSDSYLSLDCCLGYKLTLGLVHVVCCAPRTFATTVRLLDVPVASICLINRCRAYLFDFIEGNSIII